MRPHIQAIVDNILDSVRCERRMDIIKDLAIQLPITALGEILGLPFSGQIHVRGRADDLLAFQGVNKPGEVVPERAQNASVELREYLTGHINGKRARPCEDLLSQLVAVESEGEKLSGQELIFTCVTLLVAGSETTTSLIGNGICILLRFPIICDFYRMTRPF